MEQHMNAILRRTARDETSNREKPSKTTMTILGASLGDGFEAAFAIGVMLGALWLLVSGYV
jgi:hypothetical protein